MFERFLYIGNIRSLSKVIRAFGLFPQQGSQMKKYAPDLYEACQYISSNDQSKYDQFGKILSAMKTLSKFSSNMNRIVKKDEFDPTLHFNSIIPFWTLSMICYIRASVNNLGEFPLLRGGTYVGSKKASKNACIELQRPQIGEDGTMSKQIHKVTKMRDMVLVSCLKQPNIFVREVIAFFSFSMERLREFYQ